MAEQIQKGKSGDAQEFASVRRCMFAEIVCAFGNNNGGSSLMAMFNNSIIIWYDGLFAVFYFDQDISDIGIIDDNVDFFPLCSAPIVSHTCRLLIIESGYMLVDSRFNHFSHFDRVGEDLTVH